MLLAARGFSGALTSSVRTVGDGSLQTVNGENEPLAGWNYIAFREGRPRTTASWRTRGASVDHVATFSFAGTGLSAEVGQASASSLVLRLTNAGTEVGSLQVALSGKEISVDQIPVG